MEKIRAMMFDCKSVIKTVYESVKSEKIKEPLILNTTGEGHPIILVHGSGDNQSCWTNFASQLSPTHPIYAFTMDLSFDEETGVQSSGLNPMIQRLFAKNKETGIEDYAIQLTKYVKYVGQIHQKPVILIGMSMGGLVSRYCETVLSTQNIHSIITLSSPHKGAPLLRNIIFSTLFSTRRHNQMTPNSDFLKNEKFEVKNTHKYKTIGSIHDSHVPDDYAKSDGVEHITVYDCGHLGLTKSTSVINHVNKILEGM